jgi:hypothetical protein
MSNSSRSRAPSGQVSALLRVFERLDHRRVNRPGLGPIRAQHGLAVEWPAVLVDVVVGDDDFEMVWQLAHLEPLQDTP